ncbi:LemA from Coxiella burnetii (plasmid) [Legionella adelaidensis]|uniref:LemA from Coxiella burnetii n=1 Tax=Legionella adelaidensis TaxID=45056 RepID=A0A0W0R0C8_9GAMM|nr:LemA family protein [Legionella adelaidensis]KTC64544.1 LemA from Coxiella burnetii [Legionella adelaidensis]VEH85911.1 LemA from Coxiella burnetii [Legionella adelaidensis]
MRRLGLIIIVILILIAAFAITGINKIPRMDEKVKASWMQVQNQYQRRMDLVPNLVNTVKGYANFEKSTLTDVINARAKATQVNITPDMLSDPAALQKYEQAQSELSSSLARLMVVVERYPDLKANQNFLALQSQLEGTENRIAIARKDYIDTVQEYNTNIRTFPGIIWAKIYGAQIKPSFTAPEAAQQAPQVSF